jgi:hypothetical protein
VRVSQVSSDWFWFSIFIYWTLFFLLGFFFENLVFFILIICHRWQVGRVNPCWHEFFFPWFFFKILSLDIKLLVLKLCYFFCFFGLSWEWASKVNTDELDFVFEHWSFFTRSFWNSIFFIPISYRGLVKFVRVDFGFLFRCYIFWNCFFFIL